MPLDELPFHVGQALAQHFAQSRSQRWTLSEKIAEVRPVKDPQIGIDEGARGAGAALPG